MLVGNKEPCYGVSGEPFVVESAPVVAQNLRVASENWLMLDIWVVFNRIAHQMMDIVISLPPVHSNSAKHSSESGTIKYILISILTDRIVSDIMTNESILLPETSLENSA